ncbi:MAG: hypothetical protein AB7O67_17640 [Vicinamibacterales bacterium]
MGRRVPTGSGRVAACLVVLVIAAGARVPVAAFVQNAHGSARQEKPRDDGDRDGRTTLGSLLAITPDEPMRPRRRTSSTPAAAPVRPAARSADTPARTSGVTLQWGGELVPTANRRGVRLEWPGIED